MDSSTGDYEIVDAVRDQQARDVVQEYLDDETMRIMGREWIESHGYTWREPATAPDIGFGELEQAAPIVRKGWKQQLADHIKRYVDAGCRVVLLRREGDDYKRPIMSGWTAVFAPNPTFDELTNHLSWAKTKGMELTGFGVVQGRVSRNQYTLDFDDGTYYGKLRERVLERCGYDIGQLPRQRSGRSAPAYHVTVRTPEPMATTILARVMIDGTLKAVIEAKGDGAQVVREGSRHKSGRTYTCECGDLANPPLVDQATLDAIIACAREFDQTPAIAAEARRTAGRRTFTPGTGESVIDRYNSSTDICTLLDALGYERTGDEWYRHPNHGENERSVHILDNIAFHFSPNDPAAHYGLRCNGGVLTTPFDLYCHNEHGGDVKRAVRALAEEYGIAHPKASPVEPLVWPDLPEPVLGDTAPEVEESEGSEEPETTAEPSITITIDPDVMPRTYVEIVTLLANELGEEVGVMHLTAVSWLVAAAIGKRIQWTNRGATYYPNLWLGLLADSGKNKSGMTSQLFKLAQVVHEGADSPASLTCEAFLARYGSTVKATENRLAAIRVEAQKHRADRSGVALVIDEFRAFINQMIPAEYAMKYGQLVCRMYDNADISTDTATQGARVLGDACVNLVGLTLADPWNSEMRSAAYQTAGIAARIIPCNAMQLKLAGWAPQPVPRMSGTGWGHGVHALRQVSSFAADHVGKLSVIFGSGDDPVGKAKRAFRADPRVQKFVREIGLHAYDLLENKILIQACKVAVGLAVCELADRHDPDPYGGGVNAKHTTLDAGKWLAIAYDLVGSCHMSNAYHVAQMTTQGEMLDKIVRLIRGAKKPKDATRRAVCRSLDIKAREAGEYISLLVEDGSIVPYRDGRLTYYKLDRKRRDKK